MLVWYLLGSLCLFAIYKYVYPSRPIGGPPLVSWWIPFFGVAHKILLEKHEYLAQLRKEYGDLFTIYMLGNYYHVCFSKNSLKFYLTNPVSGFQEFINPMMDAFAARNNVVSSNFATGSHIATKVVNNRENLKYFLVAQKNIFDIVSKRWIGKNKIDLFQEIPPFICKMNLDQLVGYSEDGFVQHVMETDISYIVSKRPLQSIIMKKLGMNRVEDESFDYVIKVVKEISEKRRRGEHGNPNEHIPFDDFLAESENKFDDKQFATFIWGIIFAAQLNTTFVLVWAMIRLYGSKDDELKEVKEELTKIYPGKENPIDLDVLNENSKKTEQFLYDMLRQYYVAIPAGRKLLQDVTIDGFQLKAGTNLLNPVLSKGAWFHAEGSVCPMINLQEHEKENLASKFNTGLEWTPFGGGIHPCSGRVFALVEVKCILSLMWNTLNIKPMIPFEKYEMSTSMDWTKPMDGQALFEITPK